MDQQTYSIEFINRLFSTIEKQQDQLSKLSNQLVDIIHAQGQMLAQILEHKAKVELLPMRTIEEDLESESDNEEHPELTGGIL